MRILRFFFVCMGLLSTASKPQTLWARQALVLQSDFGQKDSAVAAMKGVAFGVDQNLPIFDSTHDIPPYNIWEAAYRLEQVAAYWPPGTVFVSVVDPGVGTDRRSVVMKSKSGHYFVSPDNGTLTLVAEQLGVEELRLIDEKLNRRPGSEQSYTFHGRDVFALTGAKLASGLINFEGVGPKLTEQPLMIAYAKAQQQGGALQGGIPILDIAYGNIWTNISRELFLWAGYRLGETLCFAIVHNKEIVFQGQAPYVNSFGDVPVGKPLIYINSLMQVAIALNMGSFAEVHHIASGPEWMISLRHCSKKP